MGGRNLLNPRVLLASGGGSQCLFSEVGDELIGIFDVKKDIDFVGGR